MCLFGSGGGGASSGPATGTLIEDPPTGNVIDPQPGGGVDPNKDELKMPTQGGGNTGQSSGSQSGKSYAGGM